MEVYLQYCGGGNSSTSGEIPSVLWRFFSIVGDNISTVHWWDNISTCGGYHQYSGGITSVLWRVFCTVGIPSVQWGITSVLWRLLSTVEIKI